MSTLHHSKLTKTLILIILGWHVSPSQMYLCSSKIKVSSSYIPINAFCTVVKPKQTKVFQGYTQSILSCWIQWKLWINQMTNLSSVININKLDDLRNSFHPVFWWHFKCYQCDRGLLSKMAIFWQFNVRFLTVFFPPGARKVHGHHIINPFINKPFLTLWDAWPGYILINSIGQM